MVFLCCVPNSESIIVIPSKYDVLGSRGGRSNFHYGNRLYRKVVCFLQPMFNISVTDTKEKKKLAVCVVDTLKQVLGTRFVQLKNKCYTNEAKIMDHKKAVSKVLQCFRENHKPDRLPVLDRQEEQANATDARRVYVEVLRILYPAQFAAMSARTEPGLQDTNRWMTRGDTDKSNAPNQPCIVTQMGRETTSSQTIHTTLDVDEVAATDAATKDNIHSDEQDSSVGEIKTNRQLHVDDYRQQSPSVRPAVTTSDGDESMAPSSVSGAPKLQLDPEQLKLWLDPLDWGLEPVPLSELTSPHQELIGSLDEFTNELLQHLQGSVLQVSDFSQELLAPLHTN